MLHTNQMDAQLGQTRQALAETELFNLLPADIAERLVSAADIVVLEKGESLYLQNDTADWFYLVLTGWVKTFRETQDGEEAIIELLSSGDFVGEMTVLEEGYYSDNAAAADRVVAIRLPMSLLKQSLNSNHQVALKMLKTLSDKRLRQAQEIESLKLQNAPQRIGCFLLRQCKGKTEGEQTIKLPYEKSLIATQLGMKGETFSRALSKLKSATGIKAKGADLDVPEIDGLACFVCSGCSNEYPCKDYLLAR